MDFDLINGDTFDLGSPLYSITDITVANGNGPHRHSHIEHIFHRNDFEWELIEENDGLRRGSVRYYLVNGETHVEFSRTGLEQAGNHIRFENGTDDEFIDQICNELFRVLATVEYSSIEVSENGDVYADIDGDHNVTVVKNMSGENVSYGDLSQSQRIMYSKYFDALTTALDEFNHVETADEIEDVVTSYRDERRNIREKYSEYDTAPRIHEEVVPTIEEDGWSVPTDNMDHSGLLSVLIHDSFEYEIVVTTDYVELVYNEGFDINDDETIFHEEYETEDELRSLIDRGFDHVADSVE